MKRNWQLVTYFTLVFLAGLGVGVLGQRLYSAGTVIAKAPRPKSPDEFRKAYMDEMRTRLKLEPDQLQKLGVILDDTRAKYREMRERSKPEMTAIQNDQVSKIDAILNEGQRTEYAKLRQERDERRKKLERERGE